MITVTLRSRQDSRVVAVCHVETLDEEQRVDIRRAARALNLDADIAMVGQ